MNQLFCKNYNLDQASVEELKKIFTFVTDPRSSSPSTPYNLLIEYDNEEEGASFVRDLAKWLVDHNHTQKKNVCICSETELIKLPFRPSRYFACIIEADGSSEKKQLEQISNYIESTPTTIFIISTTVSDINLRFKPNEHLYYRVLPYHIHIGDVNGDIMSERLFSLLEAEGFTTTDDFRSELYIYNSTIYPKADLKNGAYLKDLFRRVRNNHIGSGNTSRCIESDSVPYYIKPPEKTGSALIVKSLPLEEDPLDPDQASNDNFNVLFMALSTFPRSVLNQAFFTIKDSDGTERRFSYFYQLEPIPRMLSMKLDKEGHERIDKLILLCSKETTAPASICINNQQIEISPYDFLINRISNRLAPEKVDDPRIKLINVDTKNPVGGITNTVRYIRELKEKHKEKLQLYVDRHGGLRSIQNALNAMLSLLKNEVTIRKIYDLQFNSNTNQAIIEEADPHDLYDFVSGINEFTNYGRIKSLEDFYKDTENDLMSAIATVSYGIQLCDIATFEKGIKNISAYYARKKEKDKNSSLAVQKGATLSVKTLESEKEKNIPSADQSHEYLALFEDKIYEDYKDILEAASKHKVLEEIKWCSRKGFYQQALTLIEARMPRELKKCGVYRYDSSLFDYVKDRNSSKRYDYQNPVDFIFNQTLINIRQNSFPSNNSKNSKVSGEKIKQFGKHYIKEALYESFYNSTYWKKKENAANNSSKWNVKKDVRSILNNAEFTPLPKTSVGSNVTLHITFTNIDKTPNELFAFIHLHAAFKDLRNQANHASQDSINISLENIDKALSFYCEHGKNIETYAEKKSSNQNLSH